MARPRTRTAYLDLRAEEAALREGYRFLDEMRLALATEGVRELAGYDALRGRFETAWARAVATLRATVARHGIEAPLFRPVEEAVGEVAVEARSRLGVVLQEARWGASSPPPPLPETTPELRACGAAWAALLPLLVSLSGGAGNLIRLKAVYERTARRARALEEVLLPEVATELRLLTDALEEGEREEAVRVREAVRRRNLSS